MEQTNDANSAAGSSPAASESVQSSSVPVSSSGLKPTYFEGDASSADQTINNGQPQEQTQDTKAAEPPFHEHPRWKELQLTLKASQAELAQLRQQQVQMQQQPRQQQPVKLPYQDISSLSKEQVQDWMDEDPVGWNANLAKQIAYEAERRVEERIFGKIGQQAKQAQLAQTFETYAAEHPDYMEMWNSGELSAFMRDNPGMNAISAHQILTAESGKQKMEQELRQKILTEMRVKGSAGSISGASTGARVSTGRDPRLDSPEKYGGAEAVAIARAAERMQQRVY